MKVMLTSIGSGVAQALLRALLHPVYSRRHLLIIIGLNSEPLDVEQS